MKKTIATSIALITILAAASGPSFADSITDLIPSASLEKLCDAQSIDAKIPVQLTLDDGTAIKGFADCDELYDKDDDKDDDDKDDDDKDDDDKDDDDKDDDDKDGHDDDSDDDDKNN